MLQEAARPSELQRVLLPLPDSTPHRSNPEETPPDSFYFANPVAYVFHLLSSLTVDGCRGSEQSVHGHFGTFVSLWKKPDGRARLKWGGETTFYERKEVANSQWEIARKVLRRKVPGIPADRHSAEQPLHRCQRWGLLQPKPRPWLVSSSPQPM